MNITERLIHEARVYADGKEWGHITTPRILRGLAAELEKATAPLSGVAVMEFLREFEQVAYEKCRSGPWEDWDYLDSETRDRLRTTYGEWTAKLASALGVEIQVEYERVSDSLYFRRPYRVEWTRRLYSGMGQTDPEGQTFATIEEATAFLNDMKQDGLDVYIYFRNRSTGEWEE